MAYFYSTESELAQRYTRDIQPFWQQQVRRGSFAGVAGIQIEYAYALHPNPRQAVVISAGRVESLLKYQEVVYELFQNGYSVFIHDHRGQGLSQRMHDDGHRGYVARFDDYVLDMRIFYEKIVSPLVRQTPLLLCHSMGCAIAAMYLLEHPQHFSRVVFSAPMFGIKSPLPPWLGISVINTGLMVNQWLSAKPWYFLGQAPYIDVPFAINTLSHSKVRYKLFRELYQAQPQLQLGGVTYAWLAQALRAMYRISEHATSLNLPVLLLQAGGDHIVDNQAQDQVSAQLPLCQKRVIAHARHELLMESDKYRRPAMDAIMQFLAQDLTSLPKSDPDELAPQPPGMQLSASLLPDQ